MSSVCVPPLYKQRPLGNDNNLPALFTLIWEWFDWIIHFYSRNVKLGSLIGRSFLTHVCTTTYK